MGRGLSDLQWAILALAEEGARRAHHPRPIWCLVSVGGYFPAPATAAELAALVPDPISTDWLGGLLAWEGANPREAVAVATRILQAARGLGVSPRNVHLQCHVAARAHARVSGVPDDHINVWPDTTLRAILADHYGVRPLPGSSWDRQHERRQQSDWWRIYGPAPWYDHTALPLAAYKAYCGAARRAIGRLIARGLLLDAEMGTDDDGERVGVAITEAGRATIAARR